VPDVVAEIAHERQLVVLAVLHDINLAMGWADRIMVLDQGRVVRSGRPAEVVDSALLREVYRVQATVESVDGRCLVAVKHALGGSGQEPA
jgi:iron complex transport system ATP-binding protein